MQYLLYEPSIEDCYDEDLVLFITDAPRHLFDQFHWYFPHHEILFTMENSQGINPAVNVVTMSAEEIQFRIDRRNAKEIELKHYNELRNEALKDVSVYFSEKEKARKELNDAERNLIYSDVTIRENFKQLKTQTKIRLASLFRSYSQALDAYTESTPMPDFSDVVVYQRQT